MFENLEVDVDALPEADDVDWRPLHARYVRQLQLSRGLFLLALLAGSAALNLLPGVEMTLWVLWPLLGVAAVPMLGWPAISVPRCGFAIRDRDVVYKSGVIRRSLTAVPYNRIQHVETASTPFDRRFGTATLKLYTAGGSGGDLSIDGLEKDTAERLRSFILDKAGASIESD